MLLEEPDAGNLLVRIRGGPALAAGLPDPDVTDVTVAPNRFLVRFEVARRLSRRQRACAGRCTMIKRSEHIRVTYEESP